MKMLSSLFFLLWTLKAQALTVALIDTPLCPQDVKKNVLSHQVPQNSSQTCKNIQKFDRSIHGHFVLETLLKGLSREERSEILFHHYNVFNSQGTQTRELWLEALKDLKALKPELVIMALGFPGESSGFALPQESLVLAAAGTEGFGITQTTKLWPQGLQDVLLFAHFVPSQSQGHLRPGETLKGHLDPGILGLERVDFFVAHGSKTGFLKGTSLAVAQGGALSLRLCKSEIMSRNHKSLFDCLKRHSSVALSFQGQSFKFLTP